MTTIDVLMPALSPTMTSGRLVRWLKREGDQIKSGDVIAEIETDKSLVDLEAVEEGRLGRILVPDGTEDVPVNRPIAILIKNGSEAAVGAPATSSLGFTATHTSAATEGVSASSTLPLSTPSVSSQTGEASHFPRVVASPAARRIARQNGIDLTQVQGTGPRGRITKADVAGVEQEVSDVAPVANPAIVSAPRGAGYAEVPISPMRKAIARRLGEAKATVPHFYQTIDCKVDALLKWRADLNARSEAYALSVNDFVIRAVALALRAVPAVNASWHEQVIRVYQEIDVAVAVATPNGLITPIVKSADQKSVVAISNEIKTLARKARDGRLNPSEYEGGGFTVSNLGMYGIREFAAIINPPQAGILAVGAAEKRVVVTRETPDVATMMSCTLSGDHRVIDGVTGAEFLSVLRKLIEDPTALLVPLPLNHL